MGLIEERHPAFKRLMRLWRDAQVSQAPPPSSGLGRSALAASRSGRPLLIEDELPSPRRRIARLYLPLSNDDGSPDGVLCGVVAIA